jgi:flagellar protein FlbD
VGASVSESGMIQLTRLNNSPMMVNSDLIKFVEQSPDTVITLVNGEKILVRERADQVLNRIVEFRRSILRGISNLDGASVTVPTVVPKEITPKEQAER